MKIETLVATTAPVGDISTPTDTAAVGKSAAATPNAMQRVGNVTPGQDPRVIRPPGDIASALKAASRGATDPTAARIFDAAGGAVRSSGVPQLRIASLDRWPETITGIFKRRQTAEGVSNTFVPSANLGDPVPVTIDPAAGQGIANNTQITLRRDAGGVTYSPTDSGATRACCMLARVEKHGDDLVAVATTQVSAYQQLPLHDAGTTKVGDTILAEVQVGNDGKPFATPNSDSRWQNLTPDRIAALKIAVDEAGVDPAIPTAVRDEVTQILASKPLNLGGPHCRGVHRHDRGRLLHHRQPRPRRWHADQRLRPSCGSAATRRWRLCRLSRTRRPGLFRRPVSSGRQARSICRTCDETGAHRILSPGRRSDLRPAFLRRAPCRYAPMACAHPSSSS